MDSEFASILAKLDQYEAERKAENAPSNSSRERRPLSQNPTAYREVEMQLTDLEGQAGVEHQEDDYTDIERQLQALERSKRESHQLTAQDHAELLVKVDELDKKVTHVSASVSSFQAYTQLMLNRVESTQFSSIETELQQLEAAAIESQPSQSYIDRSEEAWQESSDMLPAAFANGRIAVKHVYSLNERFETLALKCCPNCLSHSLSLESIQITLIACGSHEISAKRHNCSSCGMRETPCQLVRYGLWPLVPDKFIFVPFETMELLATLSHYNPLLSGTSVVNSISFILSRYFSTYKLRAEVWNSSMRQWLRLDTESLVTDSCTDGIHCPACGDAPHCIHIDGNCKLYRYKAAGRATTNVEHQTAHAQSNQFILNPENVMEEVENLRAHKHEPGNLCGGVWSAARTQGRAYRNKSETGLMLATCRHMFALKSLDMTRGEIYEYPYILQKEFDTAAFIALDTVCRYWPWLRKLDPQMAAAQKPLLSVMHGKAHRFSCQMTWGAHMQEGAGLSTGETTELVNSYFSRLGPVTRHMSSAGRHERISQAAVFWNVRKLMELPRLLLKSIIKVKKLIAEMETKLVDSGMSIEALSQEETRLPRSARDSLEPQQVIIEDMVCKIQRLNYQLKHDTDRSKSRSRLRKRLEDENKLLDEAVKKYESENPGATVNVHHLPWNPLLNTESFALAWEIKKLHRAREELVLLQTEKDRLARFIGGEVKIRNVSWIIDSMGSVLLKDGEAAAVIDSLVVSESEVDYSDSSDDD